MNITKNIQIEGNFRFRVSLFLLILTGVLLFFKSLFIPFLSENINHIIHAPQLLSDWRHPYFRPVYYGSLIIDRMLWDTQAIGFHFTNLVLHIGNTIILFLILKEITSNIWFSFWPSMLFLVHPIHAHSVFWISGRTDMLCAIFYFFAFYMYLVANRKNQAKYWFSSVLSFGMALLSKEMAFSYILIILLHDYYFFKLRSKKYFLSIAGITVVFLLFKLWHIGIMAFKNDAHQSFSVVGILKNYLMYSGLMIIPGNYQKFYELLCYYRIVLFLVAAGLIVLAIVFIFNFRKSLLPYKELGIFFMFIIISFLPVIRLVMRWYVYIPSVFFAISIGVLLLKIYANHRSGYKWSMIIMILYILVAVKSMYAYELQWYKAGSLAKDMMEFIKKDIHPSYQEINFLMLPGELKEVPVYQFGFDDYFHFSLFGSFDFPEQYQIHVGLFVSMDQIEDLKQAIRVETAKDGSVIVASEKPTVYFTNLLGIPFYKFIGSG